jgi:error-prone DNA polymerase
VSAEAPPRYAELFCRSNFSFCEGASHPEELVERAAELGLAAIALTDRDGVYGLVRAHKAARERGIRLVSGALVTLRDRPSLVLLVRSREGWSNLCRLLTEGRRDQPKGRSLSPVEAVLSRASGLSALLAGPWSPEQVAPLREAFGENLFLAASRNLLPSDQAIWTRVRTLSEATGAPLLLCGNVLMHDRGRKRLLDVLTCIRRHTTVDRAGRHLAPNAERVLRSPAEVLDLWSDLASPAEVACLAERSAAVAESCAFDLSELDYRYPREVVPEGHSPISWLTLLCERGLVERYPGGVPKAVQAQVRRELGIIDELGFPAYFLTVNDLVDFARGRGILCQGRGSAANSAVCYVLGITSVDPARSSLLFERFISPERGEPPDIDVDFEHERREEVIQYAYEKYGRQRAGMVNEVIAWRGRSAIRDVGKVLGLALDQVEALARQSDHWGREALHASEVRAAGLDPADDRVRLTLEIVDEIRRFPRHVGIHVGGFVLTDDDLTSRVPVEPATMEGRTVIQWDKDDIDVVGFVKVDLLSLGMLTAIRKCFDLVAAFPQPSSVPDPFRPGYGQRWTLATVPAEDPLVYDMICKADTVGVFQIESRAQQSMLPRLRPRCFYDLVVEVSLVRPGPIQGGMVHPFLRRRRGEEAVTYPHPALRPILERTLGIPIFQEQVMAMAVAVAGFTPGEADQLRRAMGAWRRKGTLGPISAKLNEGLLRNGIEGEYADQIVKQIQGFGEYGFPESHAASFSLLVYVSAWLRFHYLAAFVASVVNSQPMGFYSPSALLADARRHGVEVRPIDVRFSDYDCTLEAPSDDARAVYGRFSPAIRLGFRLVQGLGEQEGRRIETARAEAPFRSPADLACRASLDRGVLSALARADALSGFGFDRRGALWEVQGLWNGPLFAGVDRHDNVEFPAQTAEESLESDYRATGLSLRSHPVALVRERLTRRGFVPISALAALDTDTNVRVAGLVTCRQRPGTAHGVLFLTLEDESGMVNGVVWPKLYERQRAVLRGEQLIEVHGRLQREAEATSLVVMAVRKLEVPFGESTRSRDFR